MDGGSDLFFIPGAPANYKLGGAQGMVSLDQAILHLYRRGHITRQTGLEQADNPDQLARRME